MTDEQRRGRNIVLSYFAAVLAISLFTIALYVSARGVEQLPIRCVRFALTVALFFWLYRGSRIAQVICIALFGIAGALAAWIAFPGGNSLAFVFIEVMAFTYLSFAVILMVSPAVRSFLDYQRNRAFADSGIPLRENRNNAEAER